MGQMVNNAATSADTLFELGAGGLKQSRYVGLDYGCDPPLTMVTLSAGDSPRFFFSQPTAVKVSLLTTIPSNPHLTLQESTEIKDKARWLCHVVNPFIDVYLILAVGAGGSPTATEIAWMCQDKETKGHVRDL